MKLNVRDRFTNTKPLNLYSVLDKCIVSVIENTVFYVTCLGLQSETDKGIHWDVFFKDSSGNKYLIDSDDEGFDNFLDCIVVS